MIKWKEHSDKITAMAATSIAVIALVVSVLEVRNQQEFQKLTVEPYIELGNVGTLDINYYAFLLVNNGLGPAIIKSGSFTIDGNPVASWREAGSLLTKSDEPYSGVYSSIGMNRRVKASDTIEVYKITPYNELAKEFHQAMNSERIHYEICYCSIYKDCWKTVYQVSIHQPVARCEEPSF